MAKAQFPFQHDQAMSRHDPSTIPAQEFWRQAPLGMLPFHARERFSLDCACERWPSGTP